MMLELERRTSSVLVIAHNVVMRALLAYFTGLDLQRMTRLDVPLHVLYELRPTPYGAEVRRYRLDEQREELLLIDEAVAGNK